ncbi:MAG: hypothetical protein BWY68_00917 [bacterium ADurb.Bin400]|nr:MAG: hypothetical protein BWY68_00917 [bacterium ADurb.Bin400]
MVARFSKPVIRAMWYPDLEHIVYQQGKQIRVMEKTGLNDTLLVELSSDSPTVFTIGNKGQELYYADNGEYYWTNIK